MSHQTKAEMMRGTDFKEAKMIGNNTIRWKDNSGDIHIRLHNTDVVTHKSGGTVILNSGGWRTPTTKDRINKHMGFGSIGQEKGIWYFNYGNTKVPFFDGLMLNENGEPINAPKLNQSLDYQKEWLKKINIYCKKLGKEIKENGIPEPSNGDCWFCLMKEEITGKSLGELTGDVEHIKSHIEEGYIHGSLILNALKFVGYGNPYVIIQMKCYDSITRAVRRYLKRQLQLG